MTQRQKGFTVLEIVIVTAVSVIIIAVAFAILKASNEQFQIMSTKITLEEDLRDALFKMTQEIRQTSYNKIVDFGSGNTLSGSTINFRVPVPAPDASTLVDSNYSPLWAADINYVLDSDAHQIIRTSVESGVTKQAILANNVTSLTFSRPSTISGLVTITASAQQTLSNGRVIPETPIQVTAQAEARNP